MTDLRNLTVQASDSASSPPAVRRRIRRPRRCRCPARRPPAAPSRRRAASCRAATPHRPRCPTFTPYSMVPGSCPKPLGGSASSSSLHCVTSSTLYSVLMCSQGMQISAASPETRRAPGCRRLQVLHRQHGPKPTRCKMSWPP